MKKRTPPTDDQYWLDHWTPLMDALELKAEQRNEMRRILKAEGSGMLNWGVQTGYLLWVRTHPGKTPTTEQAATWMAIGKALGLNFVE